MGTNDTTPTTRDLAIWGDLQAALGYVRNTEFEIGRGNDTDALMWLGDIRRVLGEVALALSEQSERAREGYARLAAHILTEPTHEDRLWTVEERQAFRDAWVAARQGGQRHGS